MTPYLIHREAIREAIDEDYYPIEWVDHQVRSGTFRVIGNDLACILFGVKVYPSGLRDLDGIVAAGDLEEIVGSLIPQAESWGRENGCRAALIQSRLGWGRAMKSSGYEAHQLCLRKGL